MALTQFDALLPPDPFDSSSGKQAVESVSRESKIEQLMQEIFVLIEQEAELDPQKREYLESKTMPKLNDWARVNADTKRGLARKPRQLTGWNAYVQAAVSKKDGTSTDQILSTSSDTGMDTAIDNEMDMDMTAGCNGTSNGESTSTNITSSKNSGFQNMDMGAIGNRWNNLSEKEKEPFIRQASSSWPARGKHFKLTSLPTFERREAKKTLQEVHKQVRSSFLKQCIVTN